MAKITRIEALMVDLVPAVKRTDAIQSFVSQQTPILRITDADGAVGTGYSYTIGTGGPAIMRPRLGHRMGFRRHQQGRRRRLDVHCALRPQVLPLPNCHA